MFNILASSCSTNIQNCCSDYAAAMYISIIKKALEIIHIAVPIILIVMAILQMMKLMSNPEDQGGKLKKSLLNKVIATVLVFFIPYIVSLVVNLAPDSFELSKCWTAADDVATILHEEDDAYELKQDNINYSGVLSKKDYVDVAEIDNYVKKQETKSTKKTEKNTKGNTTQEKIVNYAKKFVGNPYVWGGTSLTKGTDCSGFVQQIYKKFGYNLPRTSASQSKIGKKVSDADLQKGDLIFYCGGSGCSGNSVGHVAIYIGNGKIVHASNQKDGIKITNNYKYKTPIVIRRIIK